MGWLSFLLFELPEALTKTHDPEAEAQENYERSEPSWPEGSETHYQHHSFNKFEK